MSRLLIVLTFALIATPAYAGQPRQLSLDEALALAEQQNPGMARAKAQVEQAEAIRRQALSVMLPSLGVGGAYVRNNQEVELPLGDLFTLVSAATGQPVPEDAPGTVVLQPLDAFNASATLRVPLFGPAAFSAYAITGHRAQASEANAEATRIGLRAAVTQACWAEATAEAFVDASEGILGRAKEHAQSAQRAAAAGTGTSLSVLRAQTEVARREGDLLQATASLGKTRIGLGALLGLSEPVSVQMPALEPGAAVDVELQVQAALEQRAEVAAAQAMVQVAQSQLRAERLSLSPALYGALSGFASTVAYPTGEQTGWQASLNLSWSLYQGGMRAAKASQAAAALAEAQAGLAAQKLLVDQQVRNAADDLEVAVKRVSLATRQLELADEASAVAQRAFEAGTLGTTDLLDTLDRLDQAKVGQVEASARLGMAIVSLKAAAGAW